MTSREGPPESSDSPERGRLVYTVGHGSRRFAEVAADLLANGVGVLVDVRSVPASRHAPEFTKSRLEVLAPEHGLGYRWLGDRLGGRPSDPTLLRDGVPDWEAVAAGGAFAAGMGELDGLIAASIPVLLCAEIDPAHCHRTHLIAPALEKRGLRIRHILPGGEATDHQPTLLLA